MKYFHQNTTHHSVGFANIDNRGLLAFYDLMNSTQEKDSLIPLLVSIRVAAIDTNDATFGSNDYFHISAHLTGWTDRIVNGLLPNSRGMESAAMEVLVDAAKVRLLAFINQMLASGVLSAVGYCQVSSRGFDASGCLVGKIRIEATTDWHGIESFERAAIQELATLFDANAALDLETSQNNVFETVALCTGDLRTDAPTFGTTSPIPMSFGLRGKAFAINFAFNPDADMLKDIMTAGPPEMRSTPGGRRELTLLFLENEIEAALASIGKSDVAYEIVDATNTVPKAIAVMFDFDDEFEPALAEMASALMDRWPDIIS